MMRTVRRIVVIGLSNVGDAVLMSPVIAQLHAAHPKAHLTVLIGERARAVFLGDPRIHRLVSTDACDGVWGRVRFVGVIWRARPDLLIDLRQTLIPLLWRPWRCLRFLWPVPGGVQHRRRRHLWRLGRQQTGLFTGHPPSEGNGSGTLWIGPDDHAASARLAKRWGVDAEKPLVILCAGARSHIKRWGADRFAALADRLIEDAGCEVVLTGEPDELPIVREVLDQMRHRAHNAVSSTTIRQLAALMQRARLVITNDSASLHVAGAVDTPVLAIFGPTDPKKYGPLGAQDRVIQRRLFCVPCEQALCRFHHECMRFISVEEVVCAARQMLHAHSR